MALNESQLNKAKAKAIDLLEMNIANMALVLGVDESDLGAGYEIPVPEDDAQYKSYVVLNDMAIRLQALTAS